MAESGSYGQPIVMESIPVEEWLDDGVRSVEECQAAEEDMETVETVETDGVDADDSEYSTDEIDDIYDSQLLDAQQQWDESIEQLSKVLNWVLLPIIGKFMGRRVAKTIWQRIMEHVWR